MVSPKLEEIKGRNDSFPLIPSAGNKTKKSHERGKSIRKGNVCNLLS